MFNPSLCVGSGCPVAAGASVASGTGSDTAANLSPCPDSPSGPNRTGQLAQPADSHCELGVTRSSVHTRRGSKESSRYVSPSKHPHTRYFSKDDRDQSPDPIDGAGIHIKEEPDSEEWQLSGDSTLNPSDLNNLNMMGDGDMEMQSEGKRLRRVACTCPNCKESGGRYKNAHLKRSH